MGLQFDIEGSGKVVNKVLNRVLKLRSGDVCLLKCDTNDALETLGGFIDETFATVDKVLRNSSDGRRRADAKSRMLRLILGR